MPKGTPGEKNDEPLPEFSDDVRGRADEDDADDVEDDEVEESEEEEEGSF